MGPPEFRTTLPGPRSTPWPCWIPWRDPRDRSPVRILCVGGVVARFRFGASATSRKPLLRAFGGVLVHAATGFLYTRLADLGPRSAGGSARTGSGPFARRKPVATIGDEPPAAPPLSGRGHTSPQPGAQCNRRQGDPQPIFVMDQTRPRPRPRAALVEPGPMESS